jgi:hypothetical protein
MSHFVISSSFYLMKLIYDVNNRIAKALEASPDFLLNGTLADKAVNTIQDEELLIQFKKVEQLPSEKKKLVKEFLDAFIFKDNVQRQLAV